ncbi:unnamed protein product [Polarella glacialis]|uniref:Secreted protein n=1 Tax=Polarella glacialis TaxID=89957 RepID=A0A813KXP5_POLGL|nr:unnamed protein product [Polarella glacialis]
MLGLCSPTSLLALFLSSYSIFSPNRDASRVVIDTSNLQCPDVKSTCKCECQCVFENKNLIAGGCFLLVVIAFNVGRLCRGSPVLTVPASAVKGKSRGPFEVRSA